MIDFWQRNQSRLSTLLATLGAVVVLLALVHWGGSATVGPLLYLGVGILIAVIIIFGAAVWWLYLSPMPANRVIKPAARSTSTRQTISVLMLISGLLFSIGALWDEVWHRTYGVGAAVDDFFWRPHILIYISIGLVALFAFVGLWPIMQGRGDMRQRFRAEPILGLLALACGFQVVVTPLDPLWHELYGIDLTAWSLPHLMLAIGLVSVMMVAVAVQLSCVPAASWRFLRGLRLQEVLVIGLLALVILMLTQFGTTEWENLQSIGIGQTSDAFWQRPEWLYPVVVITIAAFVGMVALHTTRVVGAATLVGLTCLLARIVLLVGLNAMPPPASLSFKTHLILLPPLIALDLWYAFRLRQPSTSATLLGAAVAIVLATLTVGAFITTQIMIYPRFNAETLPLMLVFGLIMGIAISYAGAHLGIWLRTHAQYTADTETAVQGGRVFAIGLGTLVAVLAFVTIFITTATPPIV
ncbi:MAG: hypothetical protein LCI00_16550 [Chloroflexi bacterium]|nr:hypothetical protein [Chloroflexota bacterium]MCC6896600.1 hypothetical protein [Anaerolineae bacterium]